MYSLENRRRFLVLSGAAALTPWLPTSSSAQPAADPVEQEVLRQYRGAVRNLHATGKAEHARQVGGLLKILATHGQAQGVDRRVRAGIRRIGRAGILTLEMDPKTYEREAKAFGIPDPPPMLFVPADAREQAYDLMVREGITPYLFRSAAYFEAWQFDPLQVIARRTCGELASLVFYAEIFMAGACLVGSGPVCGGAVGAWIGFSLAYRIRCY